MESAKVLTTPFSINDILTRNNNSLNAAHNHQQHIQQQRRYSGADSETELAMVNAEMMRRRRKSCEAEQNKSAASNAESYRSRDLNIYKLSQCNLSSPDNISNGSACNERKMENNPRAADYMQFYASAALDNNNHSDYVSRKLGYFGGGSAAMAGNRDCPIDMRRCTSNDSGELCLL